ncbi:MAG: hypothetical protein L0027_16330 [Candidatus Rokubacteria bacterium]|nr:hypothetical protein [Candidatus Rokubacteria bacterium]
MSLTRKRRPAPPPGDDQREHRYPDPEPERGRSEEDFADEHRRRAPDLPDPKDEDVEEGRTGRGERP